MKIPAASRAGHTPGRQLFFALVAAVLVSCAPLSHRVVPLQGADTANPAGIAIISVDPDYPLLLEGLDGKRLAKLNFQSPLRSYSYTAPPGAHVLWLSSVPYGAPLLPQRLRCYEMHVRLEPGTHYVLREAPARKMALLLRRRGRDSVAYGRRVDNPLIFHRNCRWP